MVVVVLYKGGDLLCLVICPGIWGSDNSITPSTLNPSRPLADPSSSTRNVVVLVFLFLGAFFILFFKAGGYQGRAG